MPDGVAVDKQKEARKIYKVQGKAWVSPEEPNHRKSTQLGMSSPALALQCHTKDWLDRLSRCCYCNMVNTCELRGHLFNSSHPTEPQMVPRSKRSQ